MMLRYVIIVILGSYFGGIAQVGIGTITPQAQLDIMSSNVSSPNSDDGILIPRVDEFPMNGPSAAQDGMLLFITGIGSVEKGFYYWDHALAQWIPLSKKRHYVGELFGGGIIYYVYDNGQHGLIASLDDLNSGIPVLWSNIRREIGVSAQSNFNGIGNSNAIVTQSGHTMSAAKYCLDYAYAGFSDWYLPSLFELKQMSEAVVTINTILLNDGNVNSNPLDLSYGTNPDAYWSSTEHHASASWVYDFYEDKYRGGSKYTTLLKIRAVRSF